MRFENNEHYEPYFLNIDLLIMMLMISCLLVFFIKYKEHILKRLRFRKLTKKTDYKHDIIEVFGTKVVIYQKVVVFFHNVSILYQAQTKVKKFLKLPELEKDEVTG